VIELPLIVLGVITSIFLVKNFDFQAVMPLIFILLSPISRLINYLFTYYTLGEDHLLVESGVFTKKRTEIPFSTITTVDLSQNILFQLFKVYKIKVDNASQTNDIANKSNIVLTLKIDQAIEFKQIITKGQKNESFKDEDAEADVINALPQDFIKLGLLQSKLVYFFSILAVAGPFIGVIAPKFKDVFKEMLVGGLIAAVILMVYLLSIALSLIKSVVTYYNFKVWTAGDSIKVQYGLLNKKSFSLQKQKINGIIIKQSLLMRLCKLYSAEVIVIGYGDSTNEGEKEQALLFPIASFGRLKEIIGRVLPEYSLEYQLCGPEKHALRYFFFSPGSMFALIIFTAAIIISAVISNVIVAVCAVVFIIICIIGILFKYNNSGISVNDINVVLSAGGYSRSIAVIKTKSIESITSTGSVFKRKRNVVSIKLGFIAPIRVSHISSLNLPVKQFHMLQEVLKY
jgi:uncharacterized membrane protein YdbT with pleckstrin-like domain